jgi:hypothetical protein
MSMKKI